MSALMAIVAGLVLVLLCVFGWQARAGEGSSGSSAAPAAEQMITAKAMKGLKKGDVEALLRGLEKAPAPEPKMGAMCYEPGMRPERVEYVCPTCGEKTLYTKDVWLASEGVDSCRRKMKELATFAGNAVALDESALCKKCKPDAVKQELQLVIRYDDGTSHTTPGISESDIEMLLGLFAKKQVYRTSNDGEFPLKKELPRLQELLDVGRKEGGGK